MSQGQVEVKESEGQLKTANDPYDSFVLICHSLVVVLIVSPIWNIVVVAGRIDVLQRTVVYVASRTIVVGVCGSFLGIGLPRSIVKLFRYFLTTVGFDFLVRKQLIDVVIDHDLVEDDAFSAERTGGFVSHGIDAFFADSVVHAADDEGSIFVAVVGVEADVALVDASFKSIGEAVSH